MAVSQRHLLPPGLPPDWSIATVKDLASVKGGKRLPKGRPFSPVKTAYPYLRVSDLRNGTVVQDDLKFVCESDRQVIKKYDIGTADIYITIAGTLGVVGRIPAVLNGALLTENAAKITQLDSVRVDQRYLIHWLGSPYGQSQINAIKGVGAGVPKLALFRIESLLVALPSLPEQRKIAAILSAVDDAIESTQAVIDQLKVVKKAMMAELLTKGLPGRHTKFKQTDIGEVPEDWRVRSISEVCETRSGGTPSRDRPGFWNGGVPWVKTGEINYGIITCTEETISEEGCNNSAAQLLPAGAILMAMYGQGITRGRVAMLGISAATNQACLGMIPNGDIDSRYLFNVLAQKYEYLRTLGNEGSQKNLNAGLVRDVRIPVPPIHEQQEIVLLLDAMHARTACEEQFLATCTSVKSALMSVLLTGELRVTPDTTEATP